MADPALPPPTGGPGTGRGLVAEAMSFFSSIGQHLQALAALVGQESKEAAVLYLTLLVILSLGLILAVFGYIFLLLFVAFLLATFLTISWIWITLGFAVLHLIGTAVCAFIIKEKIKSPVFTETSAELKKDFDALKKAQP